MTEGIITIADETEFAEMVEDSPFPTIVDFGAPWCSPCNLQGRILQALKLKHGGKIRVVKVDVDEGKALSRRFEVQGIPCLLFFKAGKVAARLAGLTTIQDLEEKLGLPHFGVSPELMGGG